MELLAIIRYLHFIAIFGLVSTVVAEHLLIREQMSRAEIKRAAIIDGIYGVSAVTVLVMGLILWFVVGKPAAYYNTNWIFHLKVGLFLVVGLLSIVPTRFLLKNRKGDLQDIVNVPGSIKLAIRVELLLLMIIPLLATLMAAGV